MQLYVFVVITVLLIVKPTVNALFVSNLGADSLPFGYLLVAVTAVVTSYFYSKAIRKFSLVKITVISITVFSVAFLALGLILTYQFINKGTLYFYYIFVSLFAVVATSQFWIFANMVFNAREAKRIFGFIGAGAIAGGIFGGYLTSLLSGNFGNEFAIFTASFLILLCIPILKKVYTLRIQNLNTFKRKQVIANQDKLESSSLKLIRNSSHLTYIALITGIGVLVAKLVDFQFSDFANKAINNSDDLAAFFGFWFSTFNVVALTIQLFFTNKILNKIGVSSTLLILPLAIGISSLLFLTFPELWVLVIIKGIDGSFKQSLNKAAVELSIMPIPQNVKNQAKSYIDVAIDSIATGFAGFLLIFLVRRLDLSTIYITIIVLFFVFIWIVLIYKLREAYFNSFKKNIQKTLIFESSHKNDKRNNLSEIRKIFKSGNEEAILNMFDKLKDYKLRALEKDVIKLLDHPSTEVKIDAVRYLDAFDDTYNIIDKIESLVFEKNDTLAFVALDYIFNHSPITEDGFFTKYLDHSNEYVANAAILCLSQHSENNDKLAKKYDLDGRLQEKVIEYKTDEHIRDEEIVGLLLSIAHSKMKIQYDIIYENLSSPKSYIVKFATAAAGITKDEIFIKKLLGLLETKKFRKNAIKALKNYGPRIIDWILYLEKNDELSSATRRFIPRVIGSFQNENAVNILLDLLKSRNTTSRLEALKSLKKIKNKNLNLSVSKRTFRSLLYKEAKFYKNLLQILSSLQVVVNQKLADNQDSKDVIEARAKIVKALNNELDKSMLVIFRLLMFLYRKEDIQMVLNGLRSNVKEAKINSIELLDNLLEGSIKQEILPIAEHTVVDDDHYNSKVIPILHLSEKNYLEKLLTVSGSNIRRLTIQYIKTLNNKDYISVLLPIKKYNSKINKQLAYETYIGMLKEEASN